MARMQGEKNLKLFRPLTPPPGWKCPKRFRLGVGRGWEGSSDSDDEETNELLLLMASQQYEEQAQTQDSASFDVAAQRNGQFSSDNEEEESDEFLLMASQEYEQQAAI